MTPSRTQTLDVAMVATSATPNGKSHLARALLGWWSETEAIPALYGRRPMPSDDISVVRNTWMRLRAEVEARAPFSQHEVGLMAQKMPVELAYLAQEMRDRGDLREGERIEWVEIGSLLCIQRSLHQYPVGHGAVPVPGDLVALWGYCMPALAPAFLNVDRRETSITFSSANPNLRVNGQLRGKAKEGSGLVMAMRDGLAVVSTANDGGEVAGFRIGFGSRLMRALCCQGRYLLVNGYHRCYQLIIAGINYAPMVVAQVRLPGEVLPARRNFFAADVSFGPRPPFLRDYRDDAVSASIRARSIVRKIVRITADEFTVYENEGPDAPVSDGE